MSKKPALRGGSTAGEPLRLVARGILAESRAAIEENDRSEAVAVHEFRKSMKRWRALLRLLEPYLGPGGRRLRFRARDLARELARSRDAQSALDGLHDTLKHNGSFSRQSVQAIGARIEDQRRRAESAALNADMRKRITAYIRSATRAVERWPIAKVGFDEIAERLTETYRRARRMIPDDWQSTSAEDLHELRRRVIEHRYQMELAAPLWPKLGKAWVEEAQRLRDRLGRYQDLVVLTQFAGPGGPLAQWCSRLAPLIAERQSVHLAAAERLGARIFAERPKAFRRRLQAIWKARALTGKAGRKK